MSSMRKCHITLLKIRCITISVIDPHSHRGEMNVCYNSVCMKYSLAQYRFKTNKLDTLCHVYHGSDIKILTISLHCVQYRYLNENNKNPVQ